MSVRSRIGSKLRCAVWMVGTVGLAQVAAHAQDAPPPPPDSMQQGMPQDGMTHGPGRGMDSARQEQMLTRQLNLTPDQVTKLKAIDAENMQQMQALHNDSSVTEADMRTRMRSLRADRETKIAAMLTDDQKSKYADLQARMREHRMDHQGSGGYGDGNSVAPTAPPPPPPPPDLR